MSKNKSSGSSSFREIKLRVPTGGTQAQETTIPYIAQTELGYKLPADVANSGFKIVLPQMALDAAWALFTVGDVDGPNTYIDSVIIPYTTGLDTEDLVTADRLIQRFEAGARVRVYPYVVVGGVLKIGTYGEAITIT